MFRLSAILTDAAMQTAVAVATGWLLSQWYAGQTGAIPQAVVLSDD